ncbi:MAG: hypothetical protein RJQ21_12265 [Rhodospirillales bacterium]
MDMNGKSSAPAPDLSSLHVIFLLIVFIWVLVTPLLPDFLKHDGGLTREVDGFIVASVYLMTFKNEFGPRGSIILFFTISIFDVLIFILFYGPPAEAYLGISNELYSRHVAIGIHGKLSLDLWSVVLPGILVETLQNLVVLILTYILFVWRHRLKHSSHP